MPSETYIETAPSALADDQASVARSIGLTGLMAVVLGALILILNSAKARLGVEIGNNVAFAAMAIGMAMMFYHATRDTDQLIRRLYGFVGGLGLPLSGLILSLLPVIISWAKPAPEEGTKPIISLFFPFGWACFLAGPSFLIPFCRNETDPQQRKYGLYGLLGIGALLALIGFGGGLIVSSFALTYGSVMALLGLAYLVAFISQLGGADLAGYRPALAVGALGAVAFLIALIRSSVGHYLVPTGLVLMALGLAYVLTAVFLVSDAKVIVLTRRELLAYFCSPIAYILLFISALVAWGNYNEFADIVSDTRGVMFEPIVLPFFLGTLYGAIMLVFQVPVLTMRLFAEEKRTGTYEVLMCAPVSETPVVISKVLASLTFFMLIWAVWLVFLLDLRVQSGKEFDYRPIMTFYLVLLVNGAAFITMGVFFSSLTRNQIVAAALTFVGMLAWLVPWYILRNVPDETPKFVVLRPLSFVHLWADALQGRLHIRDLFIQSSIAVFWSFLTVKVLEARRWT
ncbi:MAG TPA: ABC transporter permease [Gemmataceae bacterium]|nr:ABC transporter permease [Gemmataceae bacterium]